MRSVIVCACASLPPGVKILTWCFTRVRHHWSHRNMQKSEKNSKKKHGCIWVWAFVSRGNWTAVHLLWQPEFKIYIQCFDPHSLCIMYDTPGAPKLPKSLTRNSFSPLCSLPRVSRVRGPPPDRTRANTTHCLLSECLQIYSYRKLSWNQNLLPLISSKCTLPCVERNLPKLRRRRRTGRNVVHRLQRWRGCQSLAHTPLLQQEGFDARPDLLGKDALELADNVIKEQKCQSDFFWAFISTNWEQFHYRCWSCAAGKTAWEETKAHIAPPGSWRCSLLTARCRLIDLPLKPRRGQRAATARTPLPCEPKGHPACTLS